MTLYARRQKVSFTKSKRSFGYTMYVYFNKHTNNNVRFSSKPIRKILDCNVMICDVSNTIGFGAAGNISCYGPVPAVRANVVIELFVLYKADYSSHNGSFWCSEECHNIFFLKMFLILK